MIWLIVLCLAGCKVRDSDQPFKGNNKYVEHYSADQIYAIRRALERIADALETRK